MNSFFLLLACDSDNDFQPQTLTSLLKNWYSDWSTNTSLIHKIKRTIIALYWTLGFQFLPEVSSFNAMQPTLRIDHLFIVSYGFLLSLFISWLIRLDNKAKITNCETPNYIISHIPPHLDPNSPHQFALQKKLVSVLMILKDCVCNSQYCKVHVSAPSFSG